MDKSIFLRVIEAATSFEAVTGNKPSFVYLGFMEFTQLIEFIHDTYQISVSPPCVEVWGYTITYVPLKHHLGVGIIP